MEDDGIRWHVCEACGLYALGCDEDGLALDGYEGREREAIIEFGMRGYWLDAGPGDDGGYWECECCRMVCLGDGMMLALD